MISRATEFRLALVVCTILAGVFIFFPELDLAASGLFFHDGVWLFERDDEALAIPYRGLPILGLSVLGGLAALWGASFLPLARRLRAKRITLGFLLAAALIGPVILVDFTIKGHSGRARPINVQPFGGEKRFTPAFVVTDQCRKNCSFVSGHVATASFVMAFGWLAAPALRRRWLVASLAVGAGMGMIRMMPGGHFLSDVIFGWFSIYFSLWLTEWLFRRRGWLAG